MWAPTFSFTVFSSQVPVLISIIKNWEESGPSNDNQSSHFYTDKNVCLKTQSIWWYTCVLAVPSFPFRNLKQLPLLQFSLLWPRAFPLPRPSRKHLLETSPKLNETNRKEREREECMGIFCVVGFVQEHIWNNQWKRNTHCQFYVTDLLSTVHLNHF